MKVSLDTWVQLLGLIGVLGGLLALIIELNQSQNYLEQRLIKQGYLKFKSLNESWHCQGTSQQFYKSLTLKELVRSRQARGPGFRHGTLRSNGGCKGSFISMNRVSLKKLPYREL